MQIMALDGMDQVTGYIEMLDLNSVDSFTNFAVGEG